jgi:hypothetical protein
MLKQAKEDVVPENRINDEIIVALMVKTNMLRVCTVIWNKRYNSPFWPFVISGEKYQF